MKEYKVTTLEEAEIVLTKTDQKPQFDCIVENPDGTLWMLQRADPGALAGNGTEQTQQINFNPITGAEAITPIGGTPPASRLDQFGNPEREHHKKTKVAS